MNTVKDLLKQSESLADKTRIKLQLHVPLKKVRTYAKRFSALGVTKITIASGSKTSANKGAAKTKAKKVVRKTAASKKTAGQKPLKAAAKKTPATKKLAPKHEAATVTQAAVLGALRARQRTPQAIAKAIKANPVQVRKALSRYSQQGLIVRTGPGNYALK